MTRGVLLSSLVLLACSPPVRGDDEGASASETSVSSIDTSSSDTSSSSTDTSMSSTSTDTSSSSTTDTDTDTDEPEPSCSTREQDCPADLKCVPYSTSGGGFFDATKCVPVLGSKAAGEPCVLDGNFEATDDCDANTYCVGPVDLCRPFCGPGQTCDDPQVCFAAGEGTLEYCFTPCDPIAQDCGPEQTCIHSDFPYFQCYPEYGSAAIGESCNNHLDCMSGTACATSVVGCDVLSCCTAYCDPALGDAACAAQPGSTCETSPRWFAPVGVCVAAP